jgi:hypothetical protein
MNAILDAHADRAIRNSYSPDAWKPWAMSGRISEKLKSAEAIEARRLYDDARAQEARIAQIQAEGKDAERRIAEAGQRIEVEVRKDADECGDGASVIEATAARYKALAALDPQVWRKRLDAARERLALAEAELQAHLNSHALALVRELKADAERVAKQRAAAHVKARALLDPPEREHFEITRTLEILLGRIEPFTAEHIPSQRFGEVPYPSPEAFEAHRLLTAPQ